MTAPPPDWQITEPRRVLLTVWVPGVLSNPLNGSWGHPMKHARKNKAARERAQMCILAALGPVRGRQWTLGAQIPKRITFHAYVHNEFDSDGLAAACKNYRDALKDMRVIQDDRSSAGHAFVYEQTISRAKKGQKAKRGVEIRVEARGE